MKICFITKSISDLGGVQRVLTILSNELIKDYDIDIICTCSATEVDRGIYNLDERVNVIVKNNLLKENVIIKSLYRIIRVMNNRTGLFNSKRYLRFISNIYFPGNLKKRVINFLNSKDYNVVIGVEGYYSLLLGSISKDLNSKTIGWQHNSYDAYLKEPKRYYFNQDILFEEFLPKLDRYVVLNDYDKIKYFEEKGITCNVIHNAKSFISKEKTDFSESCFLAAGRFNYQKGFDLLIESFKVYIDNGGTWKLVIVGEGEEKEHIQSLIENYNLKNKIEIKPFTNEIKKYFLKSSALLLSSRWEGMPMIVLEALEMGVPIISYNISAVEAIVENEKQGLIVNKFKVDDFAFAMKRISESENLKFKLAKCAIDRSKDFDSNIIAKQWKVLFEKL